MVLLASLISGCASYSDQLREARTDVVQGRSESAVARINEELEVDRSEQLPKDLEGDQSLLLLERGTLLQGQSDYKGASRDMMIADQHLEWLDLDPAIIESIGKWLYSDDSGGYRAPGYERLMLNVINMVNFLSVRDFQGAKVEARRFQIMESYFLTEGDQTLLPDLLAFGNYLSGIAFEGSRNFRLAARYYSRAWHFGIRSQPFRERLIDLHRLTGYKGQEVDPRKSGLDVIRDEARAAGGMNQTDYRAKHVDGEVVLVIQSGLAPYKKAERVPIGMALTWAMRYPIYFSTTNYRRANELMVSGALKWVNFPMLTHEGLPPKRNVSVSINGTAYPPRVTTDIGRSVQAGWEEIAGPLMAAAITRMIVRGVIGAGTREASRSAAKSGGNSSGAASAIGVLAQLAVEGTLTAMDTPDTRSWTTLPATIRIVRTKTSNLNDQEIRVGIDGRTDVRKVKPVANNLTVVNFSKIR